MTAPVHSCPETLPVIYIHHGPQGDLVYADQPVLIVHVDDGTPHDRVFVRTSFRPPEDLIHGVVSCSDQGDPIDLRRKLRLTAWLENVALRVVSFARGDAVQ